MTYEQSQNFVLDEFELWLRRHSSSSISSTLYLYYLACTEGIFRKSYIMIMLKHNDPVHPLNSFPPALLGAMYAENLFS